MLGLALNELAARKRQRVIKAAPREIKNCSCLPSFPSISRGSGSRAESKGGALEEKGCSPAAFDEFTAGPSEGKTSTARWHPGRELHVKQGTEAAPPDPLV